MLTMLKGYSKYVLLVRILAGADKSSYDKQKNDDPTGNIFVSFCYYHRRYDNSLQNCLDLCTGRIDSG
jgi:hypothetical protein